MRPSHKFKFKFNEISTKAARISIGVTRSGICIQAPCLPRMPQFNYYTLKRKQTCTYWYTITSDKLIRCYNNKYSHCCHGRANSDPPALWYAVSVTGVGRLYPSSSISPSIFDGFLLHSCRCREDLWIDTSSTPICIHPYCIFNWILYTCRINTLVYRVDQ